MMEWVWVLNLAPKRKIQPNSESNRKLEPSDRAAKNRSQTIESLKEQRAKNGLRVLNSSVRGQGHLDANQSYNNLAVKGQLDGAPGLNSSYEKALVGKRASLASPGGLRKLAEPFKRPGSDLRTHPKLKQNLSFEASQPNHPETLWGKESMNYGLQSKDLAELNRPWGNQESKSRQNYDPYAYNVISGSFANQNL